MNRLVFAFALLLSVLSGGLFFGCQPNEPLFSIIPQIEFVEFTPAVIQDSFSVTTPFKIQLKYQDGDGDLGSDNRDDLFLYVKIYDYQFEDTSANPLAYHLPYMTPDPGKIKNPSIQGAIAIDFSFSIPIQDPSKDFQEIYMDIYLFDRAGHKSNVVRTSKLRIEKAF